MDITIEKPGGRAFWLVWNPDGGPPTYRHDTQDGAIGEAERLARAHPGARFFVLQAIEMRAVDSMQRVRLCPGAADDVPF